MNQKKIKKITKITTKKIQNKQKKKEKAINKQTKINQYIIKKKTQLKKNVSCSRCNPISKLRNTIKAWIFVVYLDVFVITVG